MRMPQLPCPLILLGASWPQGAAWPIFSKPKMCKLQGPRTQAVVLQGPCACLDGQVHRILSLGNDALTCTEQPHFPIPPWSVKKKKKSSVQLNQNMGHRTSGYLLSSLKSQHFLKLRRLRHTFLYSAWRHCKFSPIAYLFGPSRQTWEETRVYYPKWTPIWKLRPRNFKWSDQGTSPVQCSRSLAPTLLFIPEYLSLLTSFTLWLQWAERLTWDGAGRGLCLSTSYI